jgi:hypothetical protein
VAAIDPKRSIRLTAGQSTPPSDIALPRRAKFSIDVPDHKKDAQRLEPDCSNTEEVARPYIRFMPFQELSPFRRWPSIVAPTHVFGDGPGRSPKSQSCEFSLNPLLTPEPIFSGHPPDERQGNRVKKSSGDETCEEFVVPSGGLASEAYAVLAGGSADQVVSHVFDGGEIGRSMVGAQPAFVVTENHIHNPV